jgi:dienelactone hydrolase
MGAAVALCAALIAGGTVPGAQAAVNPFERGPDPTLATLQAATGPFAIAETTVDAAAVTGFGGATIYYPATTSAGTFGAIAVAPGFLAPRSTLAWLAARIASHGFVVINIDTLDRRDTPPLRGKQLLAGLGYLTQSSAVRDRVDPERLGVMGHSMGGGGTIEAASARPALRAAVPLTPWHTSKSWPQVQVPTLIIGAEADETAPVSTHSELFYAGMTAAPEKAYLELNDAVHRVPITPDPTIGVFAVAWLKRFVDDDARYEQFLCPPPAVGPAISEYRDTCPHS